MYTLAFALQLRKKQGKTSVRVARECQLAWWKQNIQNRVRIHKHNNKNIWIYDIIENSPAAESGEESAHPQTCCYGILWPKQRCHQRFSIVEAFDLLGRYAWTLTPEDGPHGTYYMLHIQ
jgi:hypothetical protein